jgi:hypothetical protein
LTAPIKQLLAQWAAYRLGKQELTIEIARLAVKIEKLSPPSGAILLLEYCDTRPQKAKAATLKMSRQMFSAHLRWIHQELEFAIANGRN